MGMTGVRAKWRFMSVAAIAIAGFAGGMALQPVSEGRAADVKPVDAQPYWVEQIAEGLKHPWGMTWLPNGDMLVTERVGRLRLIEKGVLSPQPLEGVPDVLKSSMFDGLLDVKADPDFATNKTIYLTYTTGTDAERTGSIMKARLQGNRLVDGKVIFSTAHAAPQGGPNIMRILFLPDKTMLVGVGSGGQGSRGMVQRLDNQSGKIIHLNRDGSPVVDGPYAKTSGARPELYAIGFRNPAGIARMDDGSIWAIDIGPKGGDELNLVKPGANYGWPLATWGFDYSGRAMSDMQDGPDLTDPVATWSPSRAPTGLVQNVGNRYPAWRGDLFTGEMMGHGVRRIRIRDNKVVLEELLMGGLNERIRSIDQGPDGYLYVLTDSMTGRVVRLRPGTPGKKEMARVAQPFAAPTGKSMTEDFATRGVYQEAFTQVLFNFKYDYARAKELFGQNCAGCHAIGPVEGGDIGPDLTGVFGRRSGQAPGYSYSAAMRKTETAVLWDSYTLPAFISNPQGYYPGTKMMAAPIADTETVMQISAFLEHNGRPAGEK